jgi:PAS domain S-box/diguanylate cyclase (GGDEF) domain
MKTINCSPLSLKVRLISIVILIFVFSLWALTFAITQSLKQDIKELLIEQQNSAASYIAADIDSEVAQRITLLNQNAKLVSQYVGSLGQTREFLKGRIGLQALFQDGIVAIDKEGLGIAEFPSGIGREGAHFNTREYFQEAMTTGKTVIGKPRKSSFTNHPVVAIAAPILNASGQQVGVLAGFTSLSETSLFGQVDRSGVEKAATIIISDPLHQLIVFSSKTADILRPLINHDASVGNNANDTKVLSEGKTIPTTGWVVQIVMPAEEAFMPIRHMETVIYEIALFLTLLSSGGVWFLVKHALRPLDKVTHTIRLMAEDAAGNMHALPRKGDNEIRELTDNFNLLVKQRLRSEAALRQSEARLARAELASKSGNWEFHLREQKVIASIGAKNIYGLHKEEYEFTEIKKAALSEYRTMLDAAMKALIEDDIPYNVEFRIRTLDTGELRDIHSIAYFDKEKQIIFGVVQDVTERLNIQRTLEQEELRRRIFLEQSQEGVAVLRQDGSLAEWNPAFAQMLGYSEQEMGHLNVKDWDSKLKQEEIDDITHTLGLGHLSIETQHRRKDGRYYDVEVNISGVEWADQYYLFCLHHDITDRKQSELALRESEARFRAIIEASPIPYALNDEHFNITYLNPAFVRTFGYTLQDIPTIADWWPKAYPDPAYQQQIMTDWMAHMAKAEREKQTFEPIEANIRCKDGETRTALVAAEPLNGSFHELHVVSFFDITSIKKAEASQRLAATVFSHAREGILITGADGTILDVNGMFSEITGYSRDDVIGKSAQMFNPAKHAKTSYSHMWRALKRNGYWAGEMWNCRKSGALFPEMVTISAVRDQLGNTQQYVVLFSDISEAKAHEHRLETMAHYDPLTGLPNRSLLSDRLQQAMAQSSRYKKSIAVCYLDLDGFKQVNDTYGHEVGDQLLIALAAQMKQTLRKSDTLARIGGDEFVVVLDGLVDRESSLASAERLVQAAAHPVMVGELQLQVSASLGITFYPQEVAIDADQLLRQADHAMYLAKQSGKNRYCLFKTYYTEVV